MSEQAAKLPVKQAERTAPSGQSAISAWRPFEALRQEIDHMFDDFGREVFRAPFGSMFDFEPARQKKMAWSVMPAVDVTEKEKAYEITAELPGLDERDIEVALSNGALTIKGEKKEEKEEKTKDSYLSERRYGAFQRQFSVPEGVDTDKIEATFKKGVLTVTLPKTPEAQKAEKKIAVKAG